MKQEVQARQACPNQKKKGSPTKILKLLILYDSIMDKENSLLYHGSKFQ